MQRFLGRMKIADFYKSAEKWNHCFLKSWKEYEISSLLVSPVELIE